MIRLETLVDVLEAAAGARPDTGYTFVARIGDRTVGFASLLQQARRTAVWLQDAGVARGDRVLVILPTGPLFARVFYGLVLCGAAPCVLASSRGFGGYIRLQIFEYVPFRPR